MDQKLQDGLLTFITGYLKRLLEGHLYDEIFETNFGELLLNLDRSKKYGVEFALNLLIAFFDQKLAHDSAFQKLINELIRDSGSEISKRIINDAKTIIRRNASSSDDTLLQTLLQLDDDSLASLLRWLHEVNEMERELVEKRISSMSLYEIMRLSEMSTEDKQRLLDLLAKVDSSEELSTKDTAPSTLSRFNNRLEKWLKEKKGDSNDYKR